MPQLKSARFGEHILVGYCKVGRQINFRYDRNGSFYWGAGWGQPFDHMYVMLIDKDGEILEHF